MIFLCGLVASHRYLDKRVQNVISSLEVVQAYHDQRKNANLLIAIEVHHQIVIQRIEVGLFLGPIICDRRGEVADPLLSIVTIESSQKEILG